MRGPTETIRFRSGSVRQDGHSPHRIIASPARSERVNFGVRGELPRGGDVHGNVEGLFIRAQDDPVRTDTVRDELVQATCGGVAPDSAGLIL